MLEKNVKYSHTEVIYQNTYIIFFIQWFFTMILYNNFNLYFNLNIWIEILL